MVFHFNDIFAERYVLKELLGRGSFGEVWRSYDNVACIDVALKIYIALDNRGLDDFRNEYRSVYDIKHPNVITPTYFDVWSGRPYLVMPYCPVSCDSLIGTISEEEIWGFVSDVSSGLAYLHEQDIIHRDIKPDNILKDSHGRYVLTDFGLSKRLRASLRRNSTRSHQEDLSGALSYMGPELFEAKPEAVKATDIWALGVTIYEMLLGDLPFMSQGGIMLKNGADVPELPNTYSYGLRKLVHDCLQKNPWERPTAAQLAGYEGIKEPEDTCAVSVSIFKRLIRSHVTKRVICASIVAATAIIAAFVLGRKLYNGHGYVDLGLSVKWATCNVGASSPSDIGDFYAWGETKIKSEYTWKNYSFRATGDSYENITFSKYNTDSSIGTVDNKQRLDLSDDVARAKWGGNWRMPTDAEWEELKTECTWIWTTEGGRNGFKVISKTNGNSIFLPASGSREDRIHLHSGSKGFFWSSSLDAAYPKGAKSVYLDSANIIIWGGYSRRLAFSVRPVTSGKRSDVLPPKRSKAKENPAPAGQLSQQVTQQATLVEKPTRGSISDHEWVDLGVSVKWATCNVGASSPSDYGSYFAWGETIAKNKYTWANLKYCTNTGGDYFSKYVPSDKPEYWSGIGNPDNKQRLDLTDDAARQSWGGRWRMPRDAEWTELREKCTWTWTTQGGKNGYKVTSKTNGNSIFLPAAGHLMSSGSLSGAGIYGAYWSSSLYADSPSLASYVFFDSSEICGDQDLRKEGFSIRPVL